MLGGQGSGDGDSLYSMSTAMGRPGAYRTHILKVSRKKYVKLVPLQTD